MNYSAGKDTEEIHGIHVSLFIFREYISVKKGGFYMGNGFEIQGNCLIIHLPKEVDHMAADEIRRDSDEIIRRKYIRTITFDFSETIFMDSSGIGLIMGKYRTMGMRGDCIQAVGVNSYIEKLLHLSGVYKFVEISGKI